jgi:hypothetical protein
MAAARSTVGAMGPPASPKQISYLLVLLEKAGYASFRDARTPLGLTQRQGSGKFSVAEASALIDRLVNGEAPSVDEAVQDERILQSQATLLRGIPAQLMADELAQRGWTVAPPE